MIAPSTYKFVQLAGIIGKCTEDNFSQRMRCKFKITYYPKIIPMKSFPSRVVIYAKDVERITGCSRKTAQKLLRKVRAFFSKEADGLVTVREFCLFTKMEEEMVWQHIGT